MFLETRKLWYRVVASAACAGLLLPGEGLLISQSPQSPQGVAPAAGTAQTTAATPAAGTPVAAKPKTPEELDSLVAPIALYPDPLLAQVLAASTYPLDIVKANRWLKANPNLKGEELTKAAAKEDWDASVQGLVTFPDVLTRLDEALKWTTELGNAFLDNQSGVMDAIQRMRTKAKDNGQLESSKEQKVEVKTIESKTVIEIQPSNPEVIYVPSYNPTVVYGAAPYYPYPYYPYPPYYGTGAYAATAAISFGVGVMMGAFWSGGCCGWGAGWGNNEININNNFQRQNNLNGGDRVNQINRGDRGSSSGRWQHNPERRGSVPYGSRDTAQKFGGGVRGQGGTQRFDRTGQPRATTSDRGQVGGRGGAQAGTRDIGGSANRAGNRSVQSRSSAERSAFGGSGSRNSTRANSSRGASSARSSGASRSGGMSRGGGGGFSRGGGGRRR
jgi:hypothetical protein